MDNPGASLFQGADIQINNSKNIEEEEDLEDQLRRKEELQNLLQANLDDFNYDESTINSSANVSLVSTSNFEQRYKDAISPNDQLQVLCRELQELNAKFEKFKVEKNKELQSQTQQKLLLEGEVRQLSISLKNCENLLVDKTETINDLNKTLQQKEADISQMQTLIVDHENELTAYRSEVAELHLKLQARNGPFNLSAKFNSEELKKSLQVKIEKLESALEAETKKLEHCSATKQALQDEVERLVLDKMALESDNSSIIKTLEGAQQQCKDLIEVIEVLKKENEHFKGRLAEAEKTKRRSTELEEGESINEKLKRMMVDKSVELDSLKAELRSYVADLKELAEYRQLKCDLLKKEFQACDNQSHTKDLILLQNDLHNYKRLLDDKTQQITILNLNNRDLKEKIEEMLLQTRTEIQNISSKYNMPQLEIMKKELERAECTERMLTSKLEAKQRRLSLLHKLDTQSIEVLQELKKCQEDLRLAKNSLANKECELELKATEIFDLHNVVKELKLDLKKASSSQENMGDKITIKDDYEALKVQLKTVMAHLENKSGSGKKEPPVLVKQMLETMDDFLKEIEADSVEKGLIEEKVNSWKKLLQQIEEKDPDEILKNQYKEAVVNLHASEAKVKDLQAVAQNLTEELAGLTEEKCRLKRELNECSTQLQSARGFKENLEEKLSEIGTALKKREAELVALKSRENLGKEAELLKKQLQCKEKQVIEATRAIERYEQDQRVARKLLGKMKEDIDSLKSKNEQLELELKEGKSAVKSSKDVEAQKDIFSREEIKARLDEEVMKCELRLRDDLQIEYQKRISDIEKRYKKTFKETTDMCKQQKLDLEQQDKKFREYLKVVLTECETYAAKLEKEKCDLASQLEAMKNDFAKYKASVSENEDKYLDLVRTAENKSQKNHEAWKEYSKTVVCGCLDIESTNKNVRDRLLESMDRYDQQVQVVCFHADLLVAVIQRLADAKLTKKASRKT
ncbi:hypothetical protein HUJ04_006236 [Dendroctonus ponderosae]|nr:hypothetical protein HUJ04_006236 [Dendroctonus ponderosae]